MKINIILIISFIITLIGATPLGLIFDEYKIKRNLRNYIKIFGGLLFVWLGGLSLGLIFLK